MDLKGKILAIRHGVNFVKKNYKKLYGYALIMVLCVLAIVLVTALSENRLEDYKGEYEEAMTAGQKQIQQLEEKIVQLTNENQKLKNEQEKTQSLGSDLITNQQIISDLKDIYLQYKTGDAKGAKAELDKIEPMGFDDGALFCYEILRDLIK